MEKTYVVATLIFGWFITLSLAAFTVVAFKLGYLLIGAVTLLIAGAGGLLNVKIMRNWRV